MAGKEIAVKKYVVRLSSEQRQELETLIRKGKGPARRLLKARISLKADVSEAGEGWWSGARPRLTKGVHDKNGHILMKTHWVLFHPINSHGQYLPVCYP